MRCARRSERSNDGFEGFPRGRWDEFAESFRSGRNLRRVQRAGLSGLNRGNLSRAKPSCRVWLARAPRIRRLASGKRKYSVSMRESTSIAIITTIFRWAKAKRDLDLAFTPKILRLPNRRVWEESECFRRSYNDGREPN